ncbi:MAG: hypothetical protein WCC06_01335, partial [Candidatus Aminicenantales bacterium]
GHYVYDLDKGLVYNVFPPGVPWLLLPFLKTGGVSSAFYMLPLMNILFALLFLYLASKYVHILFGIGVSALTFFNLVVFENTTAIMSDLPSMVFLAACFFLLFLDLKSPRKLFLFLAGAFFGFSLAIRYSNLMGIIPVLFVLLLKFQKNRKWKASVLDLCCFSGAFLIFGVIPLALYTHRLFGTFFRLVYEPITQSKMQLANFPQGAVFYLNALHQNFGTVGILFIGLGLGGCLFLRKWRLVALTGILAFAAFFTFYSLQTIRHDRYLMPIYPFLAVFYAFSILLVGKLFKKTKLIPFLLAVLLAAYPLVYSQKKYYPADFTQEKITRLLKERVESDSAIFADLLTGPIRFYADLPGYRFIWTRLEILQETLQILYKLQRPVYFFLDSPVAEEHFQWVLDKKIIGKDDIEFLAEINGIPLYKYSPK